MEKYYIEFAKIRAKEKKSDIPTKTYFFCKI